MYKALLLLVLALAHCLSGKAGDGVADVAQYAPLAATLALKAAGVESQEEWGRLVVSGGLSAVLMAGTVEALKRTVRRERPDADDYRSFPSGHTAVAFMGAAMLHKEMGHHSVWISVGGYTAATAIAVSRVAGSRHWVSDVLVGAGIGIAATEAGYWIAGQILGDRGLCAAPALLDVPSRGGVAIGATLNVTF